MCESFVKIRSAVWPTKAAIKKMKKTSAKYNMDARWACVHNNDIFIYCLTSIFFSNDYYRSGRDPMVSHKKTSGDRWYRSFRGRMSFLTLNQLNWTEKNFLPQVKFWQIVCFNSRYGKKTTNKWNVGHTGTWTEFPIVRDFCLEYLHLIPSKTDLQFKTYCHAKFH